MFKTYGSGSSGNFYEVNDGETRIALECGFTFNKLQKMCGYSLPNYAAILITHEHSDHALAAKTLARKGWKICASEGTINALGLQGRGNVKALDPCKQYRIGTLRIKPFAVNHDAAEPLGFMVQSLNTGERLFFATDTCGIDFTFTACDYVAIECNHSMEYIKNDKTLPQKVLDRVAHTHMSIEHLLEYLGACDLERTKAITLLHLSKKHSQAEEFRRRVEDATGKLTIIGGY